MDRAGPVTETSPHSYFMSKNFDVFIWEGGPNRDLGSWDENFPIWTLQPGQPERNVFMQNSLAFALWRPKWHNVFLVCLRVSTLQESTKATIVANDTTYCGTSLLFVSWISSRSTGKCVVGFMLSRFNMGGRERGFVLVSSLNRINP